jgi:electron transport complex protein RnfG
MKKNLSMIVKTAVPVLFMAVALTSAAPQSGEVITKEDGMDVVNTTTLSKDVIGYVDTTPVKIYIKKNKVVKVEALKNQETPKYFAMVKKQLLGLWDGKKVSEAATMKVDGVTGATFSSDAVTKNVQLGLEYYMKHKKK